MQKRVTGLFEEDLGKRMKILSGTEKKEYYGIPLLSNEERSLLFELEEPELIEYNKLKSMASKVSFVLQLGYFKVKYRFFHSQLTSSIAMEDIQFILTKYFPKVRLQKPRLALRTINRHKSIILALFSYRDNKVCQQEILDKAKSVISIDANPKYIFRTLARFCFHHHIILPGYRTIQEIISQAIIQSERDIYTELKSLLDNDLVQQITSLLSKEESQRYILTFVKSSPAGFAFNQIAAELEKRRHIEPIYHKAKAILTKLKISNLTAKYYADLVNRYSINDLKRFKQPKLIFYILCFVSYRYLKVNDDLVKTFMFRLDKYKNEVKKSVDSKLIEIKVSTGKNLTKVSKILDLFIQDQFDDSAFRDVKTRAFNILDKEKLTELRNWLANNNIDRKKYEWEEYANKYQAIKKNLRPIIKSLNYSRHSVSDSSKNNDFFDAILSQDAQFCDKRLLKI